MFPPVFPGFLPPPGARVVLREFSPLASLGPRLGTPAGTPPQLYLADRHTPAGWFKDGIFLQLDLFSVPVVL